jgi:O-methyltransferase
LKVIDVNTGLFYKTIRKIVRRSLPHLGLVAYGNTITWPQREGYKDTSQAIAREGFAGIPADRCFTLFRIAQSLRSVPGDVFEAGCLFGKSSRFIMSGLGGKSTKQLHVFDSFEGLSEPAKEDNVVGRAGGSAWSAGELAADERVFLGNLKAYAHRLNVYRGWIPERFTDLPDETRFALAHLDVDLYQPTIDCLEFVYDRVSPQGVIVCDDYGSVKCPGARQAFDEFFADRGENLIELPTMQALVVKS